MNSIRTIMNSMPLLTLLTLWLIPTTLRADELALANNGMPNAEIIVAECRPRMATLAALELQDGIQKISGARLPILVQPSGNAKLRIFVGRSTATDRLGISDENLAGGAYRIASGRDWIALVGQDKDFDPTKMPWPLKRNDAPRAEAEWAKAIASKAEHGWGFPIASGFKAYWNPVDFASQMKSRYGDDFATLWKTQADQKPGFWDHDQGGSLNAVYGLLRHFGARWFMPGEIGEVLPSKPTLSLAPLNETVIPDYPVRSWFWYNFAGFSYDDVIWARRLGMNSRMETLGPCDGPHGMVPVHSQPAMRRAHPEYYALLGGQRDTHHRDRGTPCFSSTGLEAETVRYIEFLFDTYDLPMVDIWPVDGLQVCQCELCEGKSASELVWGFADRVARRVHEKYPAKRVSCGAYTSYHEPPESIAKFSPNLAVWLANCARPKMLDSEHWAEYQAYIRRWQDKVAPGNILRLENNRYHIWGEEAIVYPVLHPRSIARDLKSLRGISLGDSGEQSQVGGQWRSPALEHITLYVQSQFLWDADQDVEAVLDEYCALFYGPAKNQMAEAIRYAELNLAVKDQSRSRGRSNPSNVTLDVSLKLRDLLDDARAAAGDTVYEKRIQAIIDALMPREELIAKHRKREQELIQARVNAPLAKAPRGSALDGTKEYSLLDNRTGARPAAATTFRAGWDGTDLILDIVCHEPKMQKLVVSDDVHGGDNLAISLETPLHSYYQMEINPAGMIVEGRPSGDWKSLADIKTERGADFWKLKIRIPTVGADEAASDPKHRVAGRRPTAEQPWYFNIGRQRVVDLKAPELQAFSPTKAGWHVPSKFGKLIVE